MKTLLCSLVLAATLIPVSTLPAAEEPRDPIAENLFPPELIFHGQEEINLTDAQRSKIESRIQAAHQQFQAKEKVVHQAVQNLTKSLKEPDSKKANVLAQLDKVLDAEREIKRLHLSFLLDLRDQLTAEQQKTLNSLREDFRKNNPHNFSEEKRRALEERLHDKIEQIQRAIESLVAEGRDPVDVVDMMQEFPKLMERGRVKEAEELLDQALKLVNTL